MSTDTELLLEAIRNGNLDRVKHYSNLGVVDTQEFFTPADYAAVYGQLEILKWLVEFGCKCTDEAGDGAARRGHLEVLQWILAHGGSISYRAIDYARENGQEAVVAWLENGYLHF